MPELGTFRSLRQAYLVEVPPGEAGVAVLEVPVVLGSDGEDADVLLDEPVVIGGVVFDAVLVLLDKLQIPMPTRAAMTIATMMPVLPIPERGLPPAIPRPVLSIRFLLFWSTM